MVRSCGFSYRHGVVNTSGVVGMSSWLVAVLAEELVEDPIDCLRGLPFHDPPQNISRLEGQAVGMFSIAIEANDLAEENHSLRERRAVGRAFGRFLVDRSFEPGTGHRVRPWLLLLLVV